MVVEPYPSEKYEFVNGKDDIPYMKWKIKLMFQTNQSVVDLPIKKNDLYGQSPFSHGFPGFSLCLHHFALRIFPRLVPASCPKAPRSTSFLPNDLRVFVFLRRRRIHGITWWPCVGMVAMWAPGNGININIFNYMYTYKNIWTTIIYIYIHT